MPVLHSKSSLCGVYLWARRVLIRRKCRFVPRAVSGGGRGFAAALFGLTGLCCACMAVGYRTRAATVAAWVLTMSLHVRNKKVLNGGDAFLRCTLFWAMFAPLDAAVNPRVAGYTPRRAELKLGQGQNCFQARTHKTRLPPRKEARTRPFFLLEWRTE